MEVPEKKSNKKVNKNKKLKNKKNQEMDTDPNNENVREFFLESKQMGNTIEDLTQCSNEIVEDLHQQLNTPTNELANKIEEIQNLEQRITELEHEIEILGKQVKERDIKLQCLEEENENLKANSAVNKDLSFQLVDSDKSNKDDTNDYLTIAVKEKDEEIEKLKNKITSLQDKLNKIPSNSYPGGKESKINDLLAKVNKRTGKKFNSLEECFSYIEIKSVDLQKNSSRDYPLNNFGSDKMKHFSEEREDLNDQIYELERKLKNQEKKYKSELFEKESEIEELSDEIELMKKSKSKDKAQMKELGAKFHDMENELEFIGDEMISKDKKIKDLIQKDKETHTELDRLEKKTEQQQQENKRLNEQLSAVKQKLEVEKKEYQHSNEELENIVQNKQKALEVMKTKIETLTKQSEQITEEKNILQKDLKNIKDAERLKTEEKQSRIMEQMNKIATLEAKIKQLENENARVNKYNEFDFRSQSISRPTSDYTQSIGNKNMKPLKIACPNCHRLCESHEIQAHVSQCLEDGH